MWKVSIHFTSLFTFATLLFGKKHYHLIQKKHFHFIHSGYNHKSILYPIEYVDGDQEHCNLVMATVLQQYDGHVQKDHQSKFVPNPMQFEEQVHKKFVLLHEMNLPCWTNQITVHIQQQKMHIKTSVVFPMTIFVYEPFKVHGGCVVN